MTIDEVYNAIKFGDVDSLTEWLDGLEVTPAILKIIDSLCIHAIKHNQLSTLQLLVEYAANLTTPWYSNYLMEYAIQINRYEMIEYLRPRVSSLTRSL
jgi:hypothetical protein